MREMAERGRSTKGERSWSRKHPEMYRGERSGRARLNNEAVREIRAAPRTPDGVKALALKFSVCRATIYDIRNRERWAHLDAELKK
jgi:hypothetical protein